MKDDCSALSKNHLTEWFRGIIMTWLLIIIFNFAGDFANLICWTTAEDKMKSTVQLDGVPNVADEVYRVLHLLQSECGLECHHEFLTKDFELLHLVVGNGAFGTGVRNSGCKAENPIHLSIHEIFREERQGMLHDNATRGP